MAPSLVMRVAFAQLLCIVNVLAGNNGMALKPPMKWATWNQFSYNIDANLILSAADSLLDGSRAIHGLPAGSSLFDLGFAEVGIDEGWASCGPKPGWPTGNWGFHRSNSDGSVSPVVNETIFPDMGGLVSRIHSLGLRAGWYMNDCMSYCWELGDTCRDEVCSPGDVKAWAEFQFDSLKIDSCSTQMNTTMWASLLNATGRPALVENCHNGATPVVPIDQGGCPLYHLYRSSTDIRNTYGSWIGNAQSVAPYAANGRHGPTCWAYPDMLCVGVTDDINGPFFPSTLTEERTHFGLWCILSSPLTLSLDLSNATVTDRVWTIISNADAIGVDQAWAGSPGGVFAVDTLHNVTLQHCTPKWDGDKNCTLPASQAWYKPLPGASVAVFVANHDYTPAPVTVTFSSIPGLAGAGLCTPASCAFTVRDVWAQSSLGVFDTSFSVPSLPSHDSLFIILQPTSHNNSLPV